MSATKNEFAGRNALVTGASGGIGQAIVHNLRSGGARVVATDLSTDGVDADFSISGDLTNAEFCERLVREAYQTLDGLDILVNNAGVIARGPVTSTTDDELARSLAVNVEAPFRLSRAFVRLVEDHTGGVIVNIASCWGIHPGPNHALYCMTKAALASLTQCMGRDHAHQGIRVNAVCPNEVDTPMLRTGFAIRGLDPEMGINDLNQSVPIGRVATPDDIARVVCFLASDDSAYMCGSLVEVNGGKAVS